MQSRRAAAILELLTAVSLLSLMVALGLTSLRPQQERANSQALAQVLTGALETAAAQAKANNTPVALALPSGGATSPLSQAYYLLQGSSHPRMQRLQDLRSQLPGSGIFAGFWDQDGSPTIDSGLQPRGTAGGRFDLATWGVPFPSDPIVVFTPGGGVVSNLPRVDQSFYLVCCQGARWEAASAGGQPSFRLQAVHSPWTVQISPTGKVDLVGGLPRASSVALDRGAALDGTAPIPSLLLPGSNQLPNAPQVRIDPQPDPANLPAGVDALVPSDGYLTLEVTCEEPDGECPTLLWQASGGNFSHPANTPMEWDPVRQLWSSHWTWSPPNGDGGGTLYSLNCTLTDPRGGTSSGSVGVHGQIQTIRTDKLAYWEEVDPPTGANYKCIVVSNPDGTDRQRLTSPALNAAYPIWSPDGQTIYFKTDELSDRVMAMNRDGSNLRTLFTFADVGWWVREMEVSSDGTKLYTCNGEGDVYEVRLSDLSIRLVRDGVAGDSYYMSACPLAPYWIVQSNSSNQLIATDPATNTTVLADTEGIPLPVSEFAFSPTGRYFTWDLGSSVWMADFSIVGGVPTISNRRRVINNIHGNTPQLHNAMFSPDEQELLINVDSPMTTLWRVNCDGSNLRQVTSISGDVVRSDDAFWSTH